MSGTAGIPVLQGEEEVKVAKIALLPTADEAIRTALARVEMATLRLCLLGDVLTPEQRHPIQGDLAAVKATLLTPPLRPEEVS